MKKFSLFIALGILLGACGNNSESVVGYKTTMKVESVFNAGKIARGEIIQAKFTIENTGDYPLVLSDVKGSCSCTVADWTQEPIAPGETGYIKAKVDTQNFSPGFAKRSITILSNTTPADTKVLVQATIIK